MVKLNEVLFSDIYITPDKIAYIPDNVTPNGLEVLEAEDFDDFFDLIEQSWDGNNPSYSVMFDEIFYRVERTVSIYGIQYCARKMPKQVPPFNSLGYPVELSQYLLSLSNASGLILCAGPTGAGKTTTISSLMKEYLTMEGGFAYTIEDPTEMPLDGVYHSVAVRLLQQVQWQLKWLRVRLLTRHLLLQIKRLWRHLTDFRKKKFTALFLLKRLFSRQSTITEAKRVKHRLKIIVTSVTRNVTIQINNPIKYNIKTDKTLLFCLFLCL